MKRTRNNNNNNGRNRNNTEKKSTTENAVIVVTRHGLSGDANQLCCDRNLGHVSTALRCTALPVPMTMNGLVGLLVRSSSHTQSGPVSQPVWLVGWLAGWGFLRHVDRSTAGWWSDDHKLVTRNERAKKKQVNQEKQKRHRPSNRLARRRRLFGLNFFLNNKKSNKQRCRRHGRRW